MIEVEEGLLKCLALARLVSLMSAETEMTISISTRGTRYTSRPGTALAGTTTTNDEYTSRKMEAWLATGLGKERKMGW